MNNSPTDPPTAASSSSAGAGGSGSKRTRTRTGCYTCRRRKKLCDNQRPTCGHCNRLGIPCVFPKLYLNTAGEWVPSPQPNGRGKRTNSGRRRSSSITQHPPSGSTDGTIKPSQILSDALPALGHASAQTNGSRPHSVNGAAGIVPWAPAWDTDTVFFSGSHPLSQHHLHPEPHSSSHTRPGPASSINRGFSNHGETFGMDHASYGGLESSLAGPSTSLFDTTQQPFQVGVDNTRANGDGNDGNGNGSGSGNNSSTTPNMFLSPPESGNVTIEDILKELGFDPNMPGFPGMDFDLSGLPSGMDQMQAALGFPPASLKVPTPPALNSSLSIGPSNQILDKTGLTSHLPMLLDHWVNSFSRVVSVLGPTDNSLVTYLVPLAERSQLVLCALVGWAASHLSILGDPYVSMTNAAVETVETQVEAMNDFENIPEDKREESMMALLILGGIDICRGDSRGWVNRLPKTRQILRAASTTTNVCTSLTWRSIALNLVYHDVLSSLASSKTPSMPVEFYQQILAATEYSPDAYMGLTMQAFSIIAETAVLASEVSALDKSTMAQGDIRKLHTALTKYDSVVGRLKDIEVPAIAFTPDKVHLIAAFQTFKLAAELYLRQAVLHAGSADLTSRILAQRTMQQLRLVLGTSSESQMLFPLFLAGVNMTSPEGRAEIVEIFNRFNERVKCGNIQAVYSLLLEVWKRDPDGDKFVDWRKIADESETVISFA